MHDIVDTRTTTGCSQERQERIAETVALVGASKTQEEASASTATSNSLAHSVSEVSHWKQFTNSTLLSIVEEKQKVYVKEDYYPPSYGGDYGYGAGYYGDRYDSGYGGESYDSEYR